MVLIFFFVIVGKIVVRIWFVIKGVMIDLYVCCFVNGDIVIFWVLVVVVFVSWVLLWKIIISVLKFNIVDDDIVDVIFNIKIFVCYFGIWVWVDDGCIWRDVNYDLCFLFFLGLLFGIFLGVWWCFFFLFSWVVCF